jgi:ankyrin repeat protein
MEADADINATAGRFQLTALMYASKSGCCSTAVQALLQHDADALMQADGVTALHLAAAVGRTDSCELLVAKDSSLLHMRDAMGRTALMRAAAAGCADTTIQKVMRPDLNAASGQHILITQYVHERATIPAVLKQVQM